MYSFLFSRAPSFLPAALAFCLCTACPQSLFADLWVQTSGPDDDIEVVTGAAGVVVAGGFWGPPNYITFDEGETWAAAPAEMDNSELESAFAVDDDSLLVGTYGAGVIRSDDGGVQWQAVNDGLPTYGSTVGLLFQPMNAFAELDGWIFVATGGGSHSVHSDPHCGCSAVPSGDGVYRTGNGGASWQRVSSGLPVRMFYLGDPILHPIYDIVVINDVLLAATPGHGIYRSTSLGLNWDDSHSGLPAGESTPFVKTIDLVIVDDLVYALATEKAGSRIFVSDDEGLTWEEVPSNLTADHEFFSMVAFEGSLYATGTGVFSLVRGIWKSDDGGSTWMQSDPAIDDLPMSHVEVVNGQLFAGSYGHGVWRMTADGPDADIDGDGIVGFSDLLALLAAWGPCASGPCPADLDGDEVIGFADLLIVLAAWT